MKKQATPKTTATAKPADTVTRSPANALTNDAAAPSPFLLEGLVDKQYLLQNMYVSERTLHTWRKFGLLPFIKILGKIYYLKQDLERLLLNHWHCNKPKEKKKKVG